tara:strand:+ start:257 stop:439 length:183 start_codon:yes stop_codon:yes gene_type:complete
LTNENISISAQKPGKSKWKGIAKNSISGNVKFKLKKTAAIPKNCKRVKDEAMQFLQNKSD